MKNVLTALTEERIFMKKTKIVCTLGPATDDDNVLRELIKSGMDCARFNFSHGTHEDHKKRYEQVERIRKELRLPIPAILDTKGPEVRIKSFKDDNPVELKTGSEFTLTTEDVIGDEKRAAINYPNLASDIETGVTILIDDGLLELKVTEIDRKESGDDIRCKVIHGGMLKPNKSCNFPGIHLSMPYLSERDKSDLLFGIKTGFDIVAASFVTRDEDIIQIRKLLDENGGKDISIIAKIENQDGVDNIDDILRVADGIMVARGDMGVEIPFVEIPRIQKELIHKGYNAGKQVITATQMLDSMIKNPRPTRAETTDVANAIYDGTSAIMLSGETAAGAYPIDAVKTMKAIAVKTEQDIDYRKRFFSRENEGVPNVTNAIAHATVTTSIDLGATAILTVTKGGRTARTLSKFRPTCPIIAATTSERAQRQLNLSWGVIPIKSEEMSDSDSLFDHAVTRAMEEGLLKDGDLIVITAGLPLGVSGTTNMMKVHIVGDVLLKGKGATAKAVTAPVCVCKNEEDAIKLCHSGDILVIPKTSNNIMSVLKSAAGIVVEDTNPDCHAAVVGQALDIPVIYGAENASNVLKSGVPNAIKAFDNVLKPLGKRPCGIRLDSGDIAYLSREARKMLDEAGYPDCKIVASNSLDERIISDLLRQGAAIDLFGVGERLITASSEPVFGGVYKLAAVEENGVITPKIKISENVSKITNPHFKKLYRIYESNGKAIADQLCVYDETIDQSKPLTLFDPDFTWKKKTLTDFTVRELQVQVFKNGELVYDKPSLQDIRSYCKQQIDTLWDEVLRFENPHNYYVDLSRKLWDIKHELLDNGGVLRALDGRERS